MSPRRTHRSPRASRPRNAPRCGARPKSEGRTRTKQGRRRTRLLAKIAEMQGADRTLAKRLHALVTATAPDLAAQDLVRDARLRQGRQCRLLLPERGEVQRRYATLGFSEKAHLDEGTMWPTDFALTGLTADDEEARIAALIEASRELRTRGPPRYYPAPPVDFPQMHHTRYGAPSPRRPRGRRRADLLRRRHATRDADARRQRRVAPDAPRGARRTRCRRPTDDRADQRR